MSGVGQAVGSTVAPQTGSVEGLRDILEWERALLAAPSLPALIAVAAATRAGADASRVATLLLSDPGHELRHLLLGDRHASTHAGLLFTDSLIGMAPQLALLHEPWVGEYRGADHALIFPGSTGLWSAALFPLRSRGSLVGTLNIGATTNDPGFQACEPWLLAHIGELASASVERLLDRSRLRRNGLTDPLTGWHTRRYLQSRLKEEIARCQRNGGSVACAIVDVDHLQAVNAQYGQLAGDQVLREVAARIEGQLRASDVAVHLGADEFVVLLSDTSVDLAVPLANRILAAVRAEPVSLGSGFASPMTVSVGLAAVAARPDKDTKSLSDQLLARSEAALHRAKGDGRDRYSVEPN